MRDKKCSRADKKPWIKPEICDMELLLTRNAKVFEELSGFEKTGEGGNEDRHSS